MGNDKGFTVGYCLPRFHRLTKNRFRKQRDIDPLFSISRVEAGQYDGVIGCRRIGLEINGEFIGGTERGIGNGDVC